MRSIAIDRLGDEPTPHEIAMPGPGAGEVRVAVRAAGVNQADWRLAGRTLTGASPFDFPLVLGFDFAGVVESLGPGVRTFSTGDRVFGTASRQHGSYAEFAIARVDHIARMPLSLGFEQAAATPIPAHAALRALDWLHPGHEDVLLVVGATGGVGSFAVQMAANRGCTVIATAHEESRDMMTVLGASEVIDHATEDIYSTIDVLHPNGIDALLDVVSDTSTFVGLCSLLRHDGRAISTIGSADQHALAGHGVHAMNLDDRTTRDGLERIAAMFAAGNLVVPIQHVYPLERAPEALSVSRAGHVHGRLVLAVE